MSKLDYPRKICLSPDGDKLYVSDSIKDCIHVINVKDGSYIQTIGPCSGASGICLSPDGLELFVIITNPYRINVFRTTDGSHSRNIDIPDRAYDICLSKNGEELYVSINSKHIVMVLNSTTGRTIRILRGRFKFPFGICISPDELLFVTDTEHNCVQVLTPSGKHVRTIHGQNRRPLYLCISHDQLFISYAYERQIGVFRTTDGTPLWSIATNEYPYGLYASTHGELYAAEPKNSSIAVFQV